MELKDFSWFDKTNAVKTACLTRKLVRLYAEACDSTMRLPYTFKRVRPGGLWGAAHLWVVKPFFIDAVIRHIQVNLKKLRLIQFHYLIVGSPTPSEIALGVKKTAAPERVEAALTSLSQSEQHRKDISSPLEQAATDLQRIAELVSDYKQSSASVLVFASKLLSKVSLVGFLAWVVSRFGALTHMPRLQAFALVCIWLLVYHLFGLLAASFHDSGYRKYLYFEGYIGTPDDGVKPIFPPVSRIEKQLYAHLEIAPPLLVWFDEIVPPIHYLGMIVIVAGSLYKLPLARPILPFAIVLGGLIVCAQIRLLYFWCRRTGKRYFPAASRAKDCGTTDQSQSQLAVGGNR